jgi:hypothetical protein
MVRFTADLRGPSGFRNRIRFFFCSQIGSKTASYLGFNFGNYEVNPTLGLTLSPSSFALYDSSNPLGFVFRHGIDQCRLLGVISTVYPRSGFPFAATRELIVTFDPENRVVETIRVDHPYSLFLNPETGGNFLDSLRADLSIVMDQIIRKQFDENSELYEFYGGRPDDLIPFLLDIVCGLIESKECCLLEFALMALTLNVPAAIAQGNHSFDERICEVSFALLHSVKYPSAVQMIFILISRCHQLFVEADMNLFRSILTENGSLIEHHLAILLFECPLILQIIDARLIQLISNFSIPAIGLNMIRTTFVMFGQFARDSNSDYDQYIGSIIDFIFEQENLDLRLLLLMDLS